MQTSKLVALIAKIFTSTAALTTIIFFAAVYVDSAVFSAVLPEHTHVESSVNGAAGYALLNGIEMSLFFTTFILLVIRLSILSGAIFTVRDIVGYYKKFILTTIIAMLALACILGTVISNAFSNLQMVRYVLPGGSIMTYALPFFWFILAAVYYKSYQSKISELDGSKDRSWLEGNIEG
jgi:hypothetical protein